MSSEAEQRELSRRLDSLTLNENIRAPAAATGPAAAAARAPDEARGAPEERFIMHRFEAFKVTVNPPMGEDQAYEFFGNPDELRVFINKKKSGACEISFETAEDTAAAVARDGSLFNGRRVSVIRGTAPSLNICLLPSRESLQTLVNVFGLIRPEGSDPEHTPDRPHWPTVRQAYADDGYRMPAGNGLIDMYPDNIHCSLGRWDPQDESELRHRLDEVARELSGAATFTFRAELINEAQSRSSQRYIHICTADGPTQAFTAASQLIWKFTPPRGFLPHITINKYKQFEQLPPHDHESFPRAPDRSGTFTITFDTIVACRPGRPDHAPTKLQVLGQRPIR